MLAECTKCGARVAGVVRGQYEPEWGGIPAPPRYSLLSCPVCWGPLLVTTDRIPPYQDEQWTDPVQLYPSAAPPLDPAVPPPIAAAFEEAQACSRARAHTAAAIMCRKTLEGVCAEHGVATGDLHRRLEQLLQREVIDKRLLEWAHALRIVGNEAAHDVNVTVPKEDAEDLLFFGKALLEYVFTFRQRFDEFKIRRERRKEIAKSKAVSNAPVADIERSSS